MHNDIELKTSIARQADLDTLVKLLNLLFEQEAEFDPSAELQRQGLREIIQNPQLGEIIVIKQDEEVIGMVSLLYTISTALGGLVAILEDMVVDTNHRNRGAGSQLVESAINRARKRGCRRITLLTDGDNEAGQRFYTLHGFKSSGMKAYRLLLSKHQVEE